MFNSLINHTIALKKIIVFQDTDKIKIPIRDRLHQGSV